MAQDYGTAYSVTGTDQTDANYPSGKAVNATSQTAKDGFPSLASRSNDILGFLSSLIIEGSAGRVADRADYLAEITGSPDNAFASDYLDGLKALIDPIDPGVGTYLETSNYVFGDLVRIYGRQYLCLVANGPATTVQDPVSDINGDYWYKLPTEKWLRGKAQVIEPFFLGVKPIFDYSDASYQMVFPFGQFRKGSQIIKYFAVIHDSSNVIGSGSVAYAAMGQGTKGAAIAALSGGSYTMIDGKDCALSSQGGNRPATFGRQEDALQRTTGQVQFVGRVSGGLIRSSSGVVSDTTGTVENITVQSSTAGYARSVLNLDSANSTSPNTAKTDDEETRMKNLQAGPLAEIVAEVSAA